MGVCHHSQASAAPCARATELNTNFETMSCDKGCPCISCFGAYFVQGLPTRLGREMWPYGCVVDAIESTPGSRGLPCRGKGGEEQRRCNRVGGGGVGIESATMGPVPAQCPETSREWYFEMSECVFDTSEPGERVPVLRGAITDSHTVHREPGRHVMRPQLSPVSGACGHCRCAADHRGHCPGARALLASGDPGNGNARGAPCVLPMTGPAVRNWQKRAECNATRASPGEEG